MPLCFFDSKNDVLELHQQNSKLRLVIFVGDNIVLVHTQSHNHCQMQDKTAVLETTSAGTGLKINRKKTELVKINTTANAPVTVGGVPIREVESFVYLGSVVDQQGGTDRDITVRIGKARAAFVMLKNIWAFGGISMKTKLHIFNSNVKSVLLYGCETWRTSQMMQQKIQTLLSWGASTKSNGKRRSEMKICGSERDRDQWPSRYCGGSGAGSDTPSESQHPAPHAKPWPGTHRGREREASLAPVGGETLKQSWNSRGLIGPEWPEQPRTECDGGGSLMAYAPAGAMGISK